LCSIVELWQWLASFGEKSSSMALRFRADVDYLRAIAVIAVIAFHYGIPGFAGGYVGVDVFFVISGYLISRLIWTGLKTGTFGFLAFYERRARRLLPALYVMILGTGAAAWFVAPPNDYETFFRSAVASVLFSSNMFFWQQAGGYFDLPAIGKVLIHTWSLSVEEQIYFVFPLATLLWSKVFPNPEARMSLGLLAIATVALCILDEYVLRAYSPASAFYLGPLRAWEFLVGTLVYVGRQHAPANIRARYGLATAGASLILLPMLFYHGGTDFPGVHAAVPCLGAAAFIMAFERDGVRPALPCESIGLYVGKISYSLYLWHWPVLIIGTAALPLAWSGSSATTLALLAISVLLAVISYHLIETPPRAQVSWKNLRVSGMIGAAAIVLTVMGMLGINANGFPARFAQTQLRLQRYDRLAVAGYYRTHQCFIEPNEKFVDPKACLTFDPDRVNVVLYGDSMAAHYSGSLRGYLDPNRYNLVQLNSGGCPPFVGMDLQIPQNCNAVNNAFRDLLDRADVVILSGNWTYYLQAMAAQPVPPEQQQRGFTSTFNVALDGTLSAVEAHGVPLLLFGPSLEFPAPLVPKLARFELTHMTGDKPAARRDIFPVDEHMQAFARRYPNVHYVSVLKALCQGTDCVLRGDDETPIVWDIIHLTPEGSRLVLQRVRPVLDEVLASARPRAPRTDAEARPGEKRANGQ
jgi:peptidoglycan/LPS O-acetylase OafA/YrhL